MGLDMSLYLVKCSAKFNDNEKDIEYPSELIELKNDIYKRDCLLKTERYEVGYWRKFNALNKFIEDNYFEEYDCNCQDIWLSKENITEILNTLEAIKNDHSLASEKMPTSSGFFFGSTEYDDYYFEEIDYSISLFNKVLKLIEEYGYSVVYKADW